MTFEMIVQALGPSAPIVAFLIYRDNKDRDEREKRRLADVRLAVALERFCQRFVGQPSPALEEEAPHVQS